MCLQPNPTLNPLCNMSSFFRLVDRVQGSKVGWRVLTQSSPPSITVGPDELLINKVGPKALMNITGSQEVPETRLSRPADTQRPHRSIDGDTVCHILRLRCCVWGCLRLVPSPPDERTRNTPLALVA